MKSLVDYIKEEIFATPMNTLGMGDVGPLNTDPVPMGCSSKRIIKKKKRRLKKKS